MRQHSEEQVLKGKPGTVFRQFDKKREDAEPLKLRLEDMKANALAYARTKGVVIGASR